MVNPEITNAAKCWYNELKQFHREDGPAIEYINGEQRWYINGKVHRDDGPAIEYTNGRKCWYINGLKHREDGPAVEWTDGSRWWFLNDIRYTEEEYLMIQFMKGIKVNG